MKKVTITFPKIPCSVDLTLLNAPLYLVRRVTHRRAMERMAAALARAATVADGDPEGFAGLLAQVLTVTTGSPGDRSRLMRGVLLAVRVMKARHTGRRSSRPSTNARKTCAASTSTAPCVRI